MKNSTKKEKKMGQMAKRSLFYVVLFVTVTFVGTWLTAQFTPLQFKPIDKNSIINLLVPLFIISVFIERGLEVFIAVWRKPESDLLSEKQQHVTEGRSNRIELTKYKSTTSRLAFISGVSMGIMISFAGVRVLYPLMIMTVGKNALNQVSENQVFFFNTLDILVTGGIIGGGSDGIHKVINVITGFLDATNVKIKKAGS